MIKQELTYKERFQRLQPFLRTIFTDVKKDIRDEHLRSDRGFFKRNFPGKELSKLTVDDFLNVYPKFLEAGQETVGEFITNRWLLRHLDIYNFFEDRLTGLSEQFDEIAELERSFAKSLIEEAVERFGAEDCYIFSVLNSVALPPDLLQKLASDATAA